MKSLAILLALVITFASPVLLTDSDFDGMWEKSPQGQQ